MGWGECSGPWLSSHPRPLFASLQPHERDALLTGPLNTTFDLTNEQERGDWPSDGPKAPEPHSQHRTHGCSTSEGAEEGLRKVRGCGMGPLKLKPTGPLVSLTTHFFLLITSFKTERSGLDQ